MPPAKVGVDSRAVQLIGFPRKSSTLEIQPNENNTAKQHRASERGQNKTKQNKTKTDEITLKLTDETNK